MWHAFRFDNINESHLCLHIESNEYWSFLQTASGYHFPQKSGFKILHETLTNITEYLVYYKNNFSFKKYFLILINQSAPHTLQASTVEFKDFMCSWLFHQTRPFGFAQML